jgi:TPR repeat protein
MNRKKHALYLLILCAFSRVAFADENNKTAGELRLIAVGYEHGRNVKQDYKQAYSFYCKAALMGDVESAYNIGFMYFNGRGGAKNLSLAVRWFRQAADGGDVHARQMLARFSDITPSEDTACQPELPQVLKLVARANPNRQAVEAWVKLIAPRYDIDPNLVLAVIQAESAFNPSAMSNKNAQGLMQLIPETAERFGVKDSWDPIQNIKGGTAYLHWLLRHFEGKVDLVLAAYNAGEGAVERYHGIPPYQETQNYVKQILAWYPNTHHPIPTKAPEQIVVEQKS